MLLEPIYLFIANFKSVMVFFFLAPVETQTSNVPVAATSTPSRGHSPQTQSSTSASPVHVEPVAGAVGGHPAAGSSTHDDAVLRERLKHMGKSKCCFQFQGSHFTSLQRSGS